MDQDAELVAEIRGAKDIPAVGVSCRGVSAALGFPLFLFGFRIPVSFAKPCQIILSGYPIEWRKRYDECGYLAIDPIVLRALGTVIPFGWDELDMSAPKTQQLFAEAATYGLRHGFSVPVSGSHGEGALFNFSREQPLPMASDERAALFRRAQWFTALIHERLRALIYQESAANRFDAKPLTVRERECLKYAADGMSAPVIARTLNISEHTVAFHLGNAELKLGTRSRQHTVARAVALGQVEPSCYPGHLHQSQEIIEISTHH
ncbi:MAG: LuxR family transcriptional regulator [Nevskiales bacterium]|nr:LuxR family transcriptional regulator [Nevskiales bacterium]